MKLNTVEKVGMFKGKIKRFLHRTIALSVITVFAAGCDILANAKFMERFRAHPEPIDSTPLSEQAIGKYAKGQLLQAQALFDRALQNNPRDVHALLGKGMIFQQTGQNQRARTAFEAVLALQPGGNQKLIVINNLRPQSIEKLAKLYLALLKNENLASSLIKEEARKERQNAEETLRATGTEPNLKLDSRPTEQSLMGMVSSDDQNIIMRFETLLKLRDQGLMTPDEYLSLIHI